MSKQVHRVRTKDRVEQAEAVMKSARVRRVPVLDGEGRLAGILSMNDLARQAQHAVRSAHNVNGLSAESIAQTLAAICEPRAPAHAPADTP
jgi:CBS-domain-containing membrane protein